MEREKGSSPRVKTVDGREGVIVSHAASQGRVLVRFDDGSEEWMNVGFTQDVEKAANQMPPREIGS